MNRTALTFVALLAAAGPLAQARGPISLGTAQNFAVLGGSTVTNTGPSTVTGDLGVWPGLAITGFPPGIVVGVIHAGDPMAAQAQSDLTAAYNFVAGLPSNTDLTGQNLGGLTLMPGVYTFSSSAQLTGTLRLNGLGNPNAIFVFQIGSTLTTASNAAVLPINSANGCNVYWQVGSSATLGSATAFQGTILAFASISLDIGATVTGGSALARNGAVTMDNNAVTDNCGIFIACPCSADLDGNCNVNTVDLVLLLGRFGRACPPSPCPLVGDINHDNTVNVEDLTVLLGQFGKVNRGGLCCRPEPESCP